MWISCIVSLLVVTAGVYGGPYSDPHCYPGRDTVVHLFEWTWADIKRECSFLASKGYCAVQVSPVSENAVITNPNRPWWERYQPVSYQIQTRSGNEAEFTDMVNTCNAHGIRIYVDAVINHMTGGFSGTGSAGSHFDGGSCSYPGVPYSGWDCNGGDICHSASGGISNYGNMEEVRNCDLVGLKDLRLGKEYVRAKVAGFLNHLVSIGVTGFRIDAAKHVWPVDLENIFAHLRLGKEYVRAKVAGFLNHLVSIGVTGFRIDAAKHMWPGDLENIFARVHDVHVGGRPFIYQEVIDQGGEPIKMAEYFNTGRVTDFIYGIKLADIFLRNNNPAKYLANWGSAWGMPDSSDMVVFLSNHDNQRGHGGGGSPITFMEPKQMKIASAFMLAHPYGFPRVMSSFDWPKNENWYGPPHNSDMSTKSVTIHADNTCGGGWVCEHRWRQVYNMVKFRSVVMGTTVDNWQAPADYQIAFSRGNKGYIALVADGSHLSGWLSTGLLGGRYCDVISGDIQNGSCTGVTVHVWADGRAQFDINGHSSDPVVAIHIDARL